MISIWLGIGYHFVILSFSAVSSSAMISIRTRHCAGDHSDTVSVR